MSDAKEAPRLDLHLAYLEAELGRLDVRIQQQVRQWQLAGQDPTDAFRGLHISDGEAQAILNRSFGANWGQTVDLPAAEAAAFEQAEQEIIAYGQELLEIGQQQGQIPRLLQLARTFGLDRFELDLLLVCLAPTLDLRYEPLYGFLQDDVTRRRPTVNLALNLIAEPGPARLHSLTYFTDESSLFRFHLLELIDDAEGHPPLNQILRIDPAIAAWLLGRYQPHPKLGRHATLSIPANKDSLPLLASGLQANLKRALKTDQHPLFVFYGPDRAAQESAIRLIAAHHKQSWLQVDLVAAINNNLTPLQALRLALRDARLVGAVPALFGWDACLSQEETISPALLSELCAYPDTVIIAGERRWQAEGISRDRSLFWLEFPTPAYQHRLELWRHFVGDTLDQSLETLAGQFVLTTGQIRDAVATGRDMAAGRNDTLRVADLFAAARAHSNPRLASLARKITPRYRWEDIVLPTDQLEILRELVATVRERPLVLEQWGVGKKLASSAAVTVLFAGEPGTGKTMAAEVIAAELGLDLYKIDLSTIISKYIGETEKNLEKIFNEAESSNAILFFDEADAIFGKRSEVKDAHDRYANIEISYLLQRMEAYNGVTILATNLRSNLDEAFTRRLQFVVDFPFPDEDYRLHIWQTLFPATVPHNQADLNFDLLARRFKLAGGNIRNIIVTATYLAANDGGQVTMDHLLHGTRRELQKMGRLLNEADLQY